MVNKTKNKWKTATFILIPVLIFLFTITTIINKPNEEVYDIQGISLTENEFNAFAEVMKDEDSFSICDIQTNDCVAFKKVK